MRDNDTKKRQQDESVGVHVNQKLLDFSSLIDFLKSFKPGIIHFLILTICLLGIWTFFDGRVDQVQSAQSHHQMAVDSIMADFQRDLRSLLKEERESETAKLAEIDSTLANLRNDFDEFVNRDLPNALSNSNYSTFLLFTNLFANSSLPTWGRAL